MTTSLAVIVVGGGIAGPAAAIALHRAGFTPTLYEAHERGADERGAWLTVAVNGLNALRDLGVDPGAALAAGFPTPTLAMHNRAGRHLADLVWWFANPPSKREPSAAELAGWHPPRWRAHLLRLFADDAAPATALIHATADVVGPWNTYEMPRLPVWQDGRIVLVGDAAHATSPSAGQGASLAIEDAVALGRCLRSYAAGGSGVPAAPAAYERLRRARVEKVVAYGRRNSSPKAVGPIGAAVRDLVLPTALRLLHRRGNPQSWILDHRVDGG